MAAQTDKLTNRVGVSSLQSPPPLAVGWTTLNKLKATKINYENFHFTFEFLVTCNFVKLMRLFGVPNLIMKMSLCLGLYFCLCLCLFLSV